MAEPVPCEVGVQVPRGDHTEVPLESLGRKAGSKPQPPARASSRRRPPRGGLPKATAFGRGRLLGAQNRGACYDRSGKTSIVDQLVRAGMSSDYACNRGVVPHPAGALELLAVIHKGNMARRRQRVPPLSGETPSCFRFTVVCPGKWTGAYVVSRPGARALNVKRG